MRCKDLAKNCTLFILLSIFCGLITIYFTPLESKLFIKVFNLTKTFNHDNMAGTMNSLGLDILFCAGNTIIINLILSSYVFKHKKVLILLLFFLQWILFILYDGLRLGIQGIPLYVTMICYVLGVISRSIDDTVHKILNSISYRRNKNEV